MIETFEEAPWEFAPNSQAQFEFFTSSAPEVLISSAYGKGKSRIICEKSLWLCLQYPGARVVLARKQRAHMGSTTLRTLLDEVLHPAFLRYYAKSADGGSCVFFPNGSQLLIVGLDNPGRARSGAFTAAYVDQCEELDEEEWNAIGGRLRWPIGPYRQLGGACNPDAPDHFLFKRFRPDLGNRTLLSTRGETLPDGRTIPKGTLKSQTIISGPRDNYSNLPVDYLLRLSRMSGRYRARYVEGLWVAYEGQVYDVLDQFLHLIPRPESWKSWGGYPPPSWPRYRGIDFGYVNPFVLQWWALSPEGTFFLYREIYMTHRTVREHAVKAKQLQDVELRAIQEAGSRRGESVSRLIYGMAASDHDAEDRATLEEHNIVTDAAVKEIKPGIETVYNLMQPVTGADLQRRARLYVLDDALVETDDYLVGEGLPTCTAEEIPALRFPKQPKVDRSPKEEPSDKNDHGCDAMRYILHTLHVQGSMRLVSLWDRPKSEAE